MGLFVDLRLNRGAAQTTDEGFWPSFTDIMMVIVMIFLIATSILIVRNWELLREITQTSEEKRMAAELAYNKSLENATLEEQISQAQHLISMLRLEKLRLNELQEQKDKELNASLEREKTLLDEKDALKQKISLALQRFDELATSMKSLQQRYSESELTLVEALQKLTDSDQQLKVSQTSLEEMQRELAAANIAMADLKRQQQARESRILSLQSESQLSLEELEKLRKEYAVLNQKYEKLVRPARTAKGKYVVSLRHTLENGVAIYELKQPAALNFTRYDLKQLHVQLAALKVSKQDKLYIKIIFPEDSGLTYNQAWEFTSKILDSYDYYYE